MSKETAVSTEALALLLEVGSLKLHACTFVGSKRPPGTGLLVHGVLGLCIGGTKRGIKRTRESLDTDVVLRFVQKLSAAVEGLAAARRSRGVVGLLVVTVGRDDDRFKAIQGRAYVSGTRLLDVLSEDAALESGHGVRLAAGALSQVPLGVAFNEDVETCACAGFIAVQRTGVDIVACEFFEGKISIALNGTVVVCESLLVR